MFDDFWEKERNIATVSKYCDFARSRHNEKVVISNNTARSGQITRVRARVPNGRSVCRYSVPCTDHEAERSRARPWNEIVFCGEGGPERKRGTTFSLSRQKVQKCARVVYLWFGVAITTMVAIWATARGPTSCRAPSSRAPLCGPDFTA